MKIQKIFETIDIGEARILNSAQANNTRCKIPNKPTKGDSKNGIVRKEKYKNYHALCIRSSWLSNGIPR